MEKDIVLGKLFAIHELLLKQKKNMHKIDSNNDFSMQIDKISVTGRNILRLLLKKGSLNQRTIAKYSNISSQAVSETLKKLLSLSLIQKNNGSINNENLIDLTSQGKEIAMILDLNIKKHADIVFHNITEEELEQLHLLLEKLNVQ